MGKSAPLILAALAFSACGESTDISGVYSGNATFVTSTTGAAPATVTITNTDDGVDAQLGPLCDLPADQLYEANQSSSKEESNFFVFRSDTVVTGASCTLSLGGTDVAFSVHAGDLMGFAGGTLTLQVGGTAADGVTYVDYQFAGAE